MRAFIRLLLHAAIGGLGGGLAMVPAGVPITARTVLFPALGSALTSVISLLASNPFKQ